MRGGPRLRIAFAATAVTAAAAAQHVVSGDAGQGDRTLARDITEQMSARPEYGASSQVRLLSQPAASFDVQLRWQPLVADPDAARRASLALRASRRAYDGAPPVMPHSRSFARSKSCLDCHAEGFRLGARFGPPISHPHLTNCMQCHVESTRPELAGAGGGEIGNTFAGAGPAGTGGRAWTGAPPVMPHATLMRTDCLSCHGPQGYPGLRTSHPQRTNCVQCHAVAAALDQTSPFFTGRPTPVAPPDAGDIDPTGP